MPENTKRSPVDILLIFAIFTNSTQGTVVTVDSNLRNSILLDIIRDLETRNVDIETNKLALNIKLANFLRHENKSLSHRVPLRVYKWYIEKQKSSESNKKSSSFMDMTGIWGYPKLLQI